MKKHKPKKKILLVVGTRPEVIKMAPIYFALKKSRYLTPILLSSGQHKQMLKQSLVSFGLKVDYDLKIMRPNQNLANITAKIVKALFSSLLQLRPDAILLQGDTSTVLGSAIAAFYANIPIGHVEAGLRTGNMSSPWPEEMNRRLVSPLCKWNFCPTKTSFKNLRMELIPKNKCYITGNTVIDALLWMKKQTINLIKNSNDAVKKLGVRKRFAEKYINNPKAKIILVTGHRRESFGRGFQNICKGILKVMKRNPKVGLIYPVHLNPNVQQPVYKLLGALDNIQLIQPVDYKLFVWLMKRCVFVLSDSGGVQEESPSLGKPVLVMRDTTERPEGIAAGTSQLVGADPNSISKAMSRLLSKKIKYKQLKKRTNPFGDGKAAERICKILENDFAYLSRRPSKK